MAGEVSGKAVTCLRAKPLQETQKRQKRQSQFNQWAATDGSFTLLASLTLLWCFLARVAPARPNPITALLPFWIRGFAFSINWVGIGDGFFNPYACYAVSILRRSLPKTICVSVKNTPSAMAPAKLSAPTFLSWLRPGL